jgi:hypothetical protein
MLRAVTRFISESCRTLLGLLSVTLITVSAVAILTIIALELTGAELSPYVGILAYMALPAAFMLGLVGVAVARIRVRRAARLGKQLRPTFDLSDPRDRERLVAVAALTAVNVAIMALVSYHGVHYMDSTGFCGKMCHQVMEPEFTAYQNSPHARVSCTDCHIGPGASWFVKSKLSGTRQVLAVAFDTYERPIPTPIEDLRPARETCEQCHWPAKFHGDRVKVLSRYEQATPSSRPSSSSRSAAAASSPASAPASTGTWRAVSTIAHHRIAARSTGCGSTTATAPRASTGVRPRKGSRTA